MDTGNRRLLLVLVVLLILVLLGPAVGAGMMGPWMMGGYGAAAPLAGGWTWALAAVLGVVSMLAFWGVLIAGVILLIRWLTGLTASSASTGGDSALDTLRRRYAAGALTQEEYERIRQVLQR